ncbi:MAG: DUF1007 family protein [Spirochaetaceae bacterium]|nr:MAG: DUF1007 family protein [Spirochaetaceae bacterium]
MRVQHRGNFRYRCQQKTGQYEQKASLAHDTRRQRRVEQDETQAIHAPGDKARHVQEQPGTGRRLKRVRRLRRFWCRPRGLRRRSRLRGLRRSRPGSRPCCRNVRSDPHPSTYDVRVNEDRGHRDHRRNGKPRQTLYPGTGGKGGRNGPCEQGSSAGRYQQRHRKASTGSDDQLGGNKRLRGGEADGSRGEQPRVRVEPTGVVPDVQGRRPCYRNRPRFRRGRKRILRRPCTPSGDTCSEYACGNAYEHGDGKPVSLPRREKQRRCGEREQVDNSARVGHSRFCCWRRHVSPCVGQKRTQAHPGASQTLHRTVKPRLIPPDEYRQQDAGQHEGQDDRCRHPHEQRQDRGEVLESRHTHRKRKSADRYTEDHDQQNETGERCGGDRFRLHERDSKCTIRYARLESSMMIRPKTILPLVLLLFFAAEGVSSHPHVFIDSRVSLHVSGNRLTHVRAHWTFDRFFTQMVVMDFRLDRSGDFSDAQIQEVEQGAFRNLENYDYYTYISVDGRSIDANRVENFHASLNADGRLVYEFDIPVGLDIGSRNRRVEIAMYDESFFTDMIFADDFLIVNGQNRVRYESELTHSVHDTGLWGPMVREAVIVRFLNGN